MSELRSCLSSLKEVHLNIVDHSIVCTQVQDVLEVAQIREPICDSMICPMQEHKVDLMQRASWYLAIMLPSVDTIPWYNIPRSCTIRLAVALCFPSPCIGYVL